MERSGLRNERGTVRALHDRCHRPGWDEYVTEVSARNPGKTFASNDLRYGYDAMPLDTHMEYKFRNFEPETLVVERVQTAFSERGKGHAVRMLTEAIEGCGRPVAAIAIESPNQNSVAWWDGPVAREMAERYPDVQVVPIPEREKESAKNFDPVWVLLT